MRVMTKLVKDHCISCKWYEGDGAKLKTCPNCSNACCHDCRDAKDRCARCAEYDLPEWLKVLEPSDKCDLKFSCMEFHGVGVHFHVTIEETREARMAKVPRGGGPAPFLDGPEFYEHTKFNTQVGVHGWLVMQAKRFKEEYGKDEVTVRFDDFETRTWFYKEGD